MTEIKKIFLVDDDSIFLSIAKMVLKNIFKDAEIVTLTNGLEGLKHLEAGEPNLLFLDINMPVMNGWEFLNELLKKKQTFPFSIIITSSSIDPKDRQMAQNHPLVNGYIEKPITREKVISLVS